ncbi:unnamed protein product [Symbiodinium natans]|uniref:Uncharacterized protein n=1 Tax=Symbiodinium natans TaxID=878477 RepID=A0A812K458_9DINO|nr:unnamed protein product [Symbiodinium natans]
MEARWELVKPLEGTQRPRKRYQHSAVVDVASRSLIIFGGIDRAGGMFNDVRAFSLEAKAWAVLGQASGPKNNGPWPSWPSACYGHSAILDSAAHAMVIFGGSDADCRVLGEAAARRPAAGSQVRAFG